MGLLVATELLGVDEYKYSDTAVLAADLWWGAN